MNSNLIPVPRTDKNGRVTIRHMRSDSTPASGSVAGIPQVSSPAPVKSVTDPNTELLTAIYGEDGDTELPRNHEAAIAFMNKEHPALLETATELLGKGSEGGSQSVRNFMIDSLRVLGDTLSVHNERDPLILSYTEGLSAGMEESLIRVWAVGSVREEFTGTLYNFLHDNDFYDGIAGVQGMIYDREKPPQETQVDPNYWRGMMALYYTNPEEYFDTEEEQKEALDFINWAGNHESIDAAIHTALERETINVSTLDGVLSQEAPAPVLGRGIL